MFKVFRKTLLVLVHITILIGLIFWAIPALISAPDTLIVILGIGLILVTIAYLAALGFTLFNLIKTKIENL